METFCMVRRIDDLGRIVIPIEIRRMVNWAQGDPIEIISDGSGCVTLRRYHERGRDPVIKAVAQGLEERGTSSFAVYLDGERVAISSDESGNPFVLAHTLPRSETIDAASDDAVRFAWQTNPDVFEPVQWAVPIAGKDNSVAGYIIGAQRADIDVHREAILMAADVICRYVRDDKI